MRKNLLFAVIVINALALGGTAGQAQSLLAPGVTAVPQAPVGHLQPRAPQFSPRTPGEQVEQEQMSAYDAQQQKLDQDLDKRLNICRGC
jgi:hypothetical protein